MLAEALIQIKRHIFQALHVANTVEELRLLERRDHQSAGAGEGAVEDVAGPVVLPKERRAFITHARETRRYGNTGDRRGTGGGAARAHHARPVHDLIGPQVGTEDEVVFGVAEAAKLPLLARLLSRVSGDAIPGRDHFGHITERLLALTLAVFSGQGQSSRGRELGRHCGRETIFLRVGVILPALLVLPDGVEAEGDLATKRLVVIEGHSFVIPRTGLETDAGRAIVEPRLFAHRVGRAAHAAGAEENRIGSARKIQALQIEAIVVHAALQRRCGTVEVLLAGVGGDAADGRDTRAAEHRVAPVVGGRDHVGRPLLRLDHVAQIQGLEKLLREDRIGRGGVPEVTINAAAGQRLLGDEADVARGVHRESVQHDGARRTCRGGARGRLARQAPRQREAEQTGQQGADECGRQPGAIRSRGGFFHGTWGIIGLKYDRGLDQETGSAEALGREGLRWSVGIKPRRTSLWDGCKILGVHCRLRRQQQGVRNVQGGTNGLIQAVH